MDTVLRTVARFVDLLVLVYAIKTRGVVVLRRYSSSLSEAEVRQDVSIMAAYQAPRRVGVLSYKRLIVTDAEIDCE